MKTSTDSLQQRSGAPELPDAPDPSQNEDWIGTTPDATRGVTIAGSVHDREQVETKYGTREVLSIGHDGEVTRVPCFRSHLRELVAVNDPQPGDGIAVRYFGTEPGGKKELYAMRVDKSARLSGGGSDELFES